jgi:hypothetical protein
MSTRFSFTELSNVLFTLAGLYMLIQSIYHVLCLVYNLVFACSYLILACVLLSLGYDRVRIFIFQHYSTFMSYIHLFLIIIRYYAKLDAFVTKLPTEQIYNIFCSSLSVLKTAYKVPLVSIKRLGNPIKSVFTPTVPVPYVPKIRLSEDWEYISHPEPLPSPPRWMKALIFEIASTIIHVSYTDMVTNYVPDFLKEKYTW